MSRLPRPGTPRDIDRASFIFQHPGSSYYCYCHWRDVYFSYLKDSQPDRRIINHRHDCNRRATDIRAMTAVIFQGRMDVGAERIYLRSSSERSARARALPMRPTLFVRIVRLQWLTLTVSQEIKSDSIYYYKKMQLGQLIDFLFCMFFFKANGLVRV